MDSGSLILTTILSYLSKKIIVPTEFHEQVVAIRTMLKDDVSGLVDSLTDFAVESAMVTYGIETDNEEFTRILKKWLNEVNISYGGQIPSGVDTLAKEYFQERWKGSSFPVLKVAGWENMNGIIVPTKLYYVDGGSIYAKDTDEKDENLKLINYKYYITSKMTKKNELTGIFSRPYGRLFDKYPPVYLIKRGVYHNWKIIEDLKSKQSEILSQVIPYLFLVKKGTEMLATKNIKRYTDKQLGEIKDQFQDLAKKIKNEDGTPFRASQFDEEIKHLIPDLETIFKPILFTVAEKAILSGLGFIDIAEGVSESRRESILNPKVFIEEVKNGVKDFKQVLKELVFLIKTKNKTHKKYMNSEFYVTSSPITAFMTDKFKNQLRLQWERGQLSNQTYAEMVGEVSYRLEKSRREKEAKRGDEYTMYPHLTRNDEDKGIDIVGEKPVIKDTDKKGNPIDLDKMDDKEKYDIGKLTDLVTAPYKTVRELPASIRKVLSPSLQSVFRRVFNQAWEKYKNESRAFRIAWGVIKKLATKGRDGKWHRKTIGSIKIRLTKAMIEKIEKEVPKEEK